MIDAITIRIVGVKSFDRWKLLKANDLLAYFFPRDYEPKRVIYRHILEIDDQWVTFQCYYNHNFDKPTDPGFGTTHSLKSCSFVGDVIVGNYTSEEICTNKEEIILNAHLLWYTRD